ncbi:Cthe_2314 family HEPN domain-containing protein [Paenibacillus arenosi]|uniref:LA2681-like HEPN domain-containing protein n=1 Tax=Paenibacillus arenosi TaxID=2774142 RepID=A0ABR9AWP2_9BACL|nr:Cthe_2314 family HEPN domain-containing protein [Paenibacillus arenosi]MBD8498513.1 hypothetical protein [Paenibacillus arenosi]
MAKQKKKIDLKKSCMELINQNEELNSLFDKVAVNYREESDDFSVSILPNYSEANKERYAQQKSYTNYLLSLLEEIHRYSYLALCETFMYQERLDYKDDNNFFSSRYFLSNASFHIIGAWERTIRLSGLLYGYDFNQSLKYSHIYNALKKNREFKCNEVFLVIQELKSSTHFPDIEELRISNDHKLSKHVEYESDDDLRRMALSCYENAKGLYQIIYYYINRFLNERIIRVTEIDLTLFKWNLTLDVVKIKPIISKELTSELLPARLDRCSDYLSNHIYTFEALRYITNHFLTTLNNNSKYMLLHSDLVFRLHEATRSLKFAYNLIVKAKKEHKELGEESVCFVNMDYAYFVESAISRVYSAYDKIAMLLHYYTGGGSKENSFEQFMRNHNDELENEELLRLANSIYNRDEYKELYQLRQNNFHHMVKENFINRSDSEWSHVYNLILVSKNIQILKPLVSKLMELYVDDPACLRNSGN